MFYQNQKASPALCSVWMIRAFETMHHTPHHGDVNAPNSWQALKHWASIHTLGRDSLPVFDGACDQSIYARPDDNIIFRAWHDTLHIKNGLDFSLESELKIAQLHVDDLRAIRAPFHVIDTIYADVAAQVIFYYNSGEFVQDQNRFIEYVIKNGFDAIKTYPNK